MRRRCTRSRARRARPLRRLQRWLGLDRNPLRRRTDRIEAAIRAALVAAFFILGPLVATDIGNHVGAHQPPTAQAYRLRAQALLLQNAAPGPCVRFGCREAVVRARWTTPAGAERSGQVAVAAAARAGTYVSVWLDRAGRLEPPPAPGSRAGAEIGAATLALVAVALVCLIAGALAHAELNLRRMASWQAEWSAVEPVWTRRRR